MMLIPTDKTTNPADSTTSVDNYSKLLKDSITPAYWKANDSALSKINTDAENISHELNMMILFPGETYSWVLKVLIFNVLILR